MPKSLMAILALSLTLAGCNGAFWGNIGVLAMTLGIFLGTLSLGRTSATASQSADHPSQSR